jgi:cytochrome c-type biogenesis protein
MIAMSVTETLTAGSLLAAIPLAFVAGLVSFLSPCVLPLVPGYVAFMTGVAGTNAQGRTKKRSRALVGTLSFITGLAVVFVSYGALFGGVGKVFIEHQRTIQIVMGALVIFLGLGFLGLIPALQREFRMHHKPTGTIAGAFLLGVLFAVGWTPCIGPALAAVQTMALSEANASRGALLSFTYVLGIGIPFLVVGVFLENSIRAVGALRKHSKLVTAIGGLLLIAIGVMQVTGMWNDLMVSLRVWASNWQVPI